MSTWAKLLKVLRVIGAVVGKFDSEGSAPRSASPRETKPPRQPRPKPAKPRNTTGE